MLLERQVTAGEVGSDEAGLFSLDLVVEELEYLSSIGAMAEEEAPEGNTTRRIVIAPGGSPRQRFDGGKHGRGLLGAAIVSIDGMSQPAQADAG